VERERLPRSARIRRGAEIRAMFRKGTRDRHRLFELVTMESAERLPRIGLVVPKFGHRIVDRNRLKRRLREIGRREILRGMRQGGIRVDTLIRVRRPAYRATYPELRSAILSVLEGMCSVS